MQFKLKRYIDMAIGLGIAGLGLSAAGAAVNFITQAREAANRRRALAKRESDNNNWYNREYNKVGTETATAQNAIKVMNEAQKARMAKSSGAAAVTGASEESVASEKAAANKAIGDTMSAITARDEAEKARIDNAYRSERKAIDAERDKLSLGKMQNTAAAFGTAANLAGNIIAHGDDFFGKSDDAVSKIMGYGENEPVIGDLSYDITDAEKLRKLGLLRNNQNQ